MAQGTVVLGDALARPAHVQPRVAQRRVLAEEGVVDGQLGALDQVGGAGHVETRGPHQSVAQLVREDDQARRRQFHVPRLQREAVQLGGVAQQHTQRRQVAGVRRVGQ